MNFPHFRSFTAIALAALLSACGAGQQDTQASMQLASSMQSDLTTPPAAMTSTDAAAQAGASTGPAVAAAAGPNNPAPDCAAEGCGSLRIIDGNAEAFRVDAMRRNAGDGV